MESPESVDGPVNVEPVNVEASNVGETSHSDEDQRIDHPSKIPSTAETREAAPSMAPGVTMTSAAFTPDTGDDADGPSPNLVRPYTLTAGRTKSEIYLPLEAPIHTTSPVVPNIWPASDMRAKIVTLCMHGPSVAEISARLNLPLGVARVLVGDLVGSGTLRVSATLDDDATSAERRELIGRTLRGLRAL